MKKLYIVSGSESDCYRIASDNGIPSNNIVAIWSDDKLLELKDKFCIITNCSDDNSVTIRYKALSLSIDFIYENHVNGFINEFSTYLNNIIDLAATNFITITQTRNYIFSKLTEWLPNNKFKFFLSVSNGHIIIHADNDWTAGIMTLYKNYNG